MTAIGRLRTDGGAARRSGEPGPGGGDTARFPRRRLAGRRGSPARRPRRRDRRPRPDRGALHHRAHSPPAGPAPPDPAANWSRSVAAAQETPATDALGPVELEILRNALTAAAAEMDVTIWRTSRSTIVRELLDYSTAVFDRDGYNVAQSARIPQHLNSMGAGLLTLVARLPPARRWEDGDVVITNDPYCGGQHIPDILAFRAVFFGGGADRHRRHALPPPRHGRHLGRQLRRDRDRGVPGGSAHPADEAVPPRRPERGSAGDDAPERAPAGHAVGRPAGAARLARRRRGQPAPHGRALRRVRPACGLRPAARRLGGGHAGHDRPHAGRALRIRGLDRR